MSQREPTSDVNSIPSNSVSEDNPQDNTHSATPATLPPPRWSDWQVEEDLQDARRVITSIRRESDPTWGQLRCTSVASAPINRLAHLMDSVAPASNEQMGGASMPTEPTADQANIDTSAGDLAQADERPTPATSYLPSLSLSIAGLIGGMVASSVLQIWPQHALNVIFVLVGLGILVAHHVSNRQPRHPLPAVLRDYGASQVDQPTQQAVH